MAGVTNAGFVGRTAAEIRVDIEADWREVFGVNVDVAADSPDGQLIAIMTDQLAELWELGQAVYSAQDPDKAGGQAQDAVCAITGTQRRSASKAEVTLTMSGTPGTALPTGQQASIEETGARFETLFDTEITLCNSWIAATPYVLNDRVTNASRTYTCITAGTSAGSGGPTTTSADITDNTAHWRYCGEGTGQADVGATALETGATSGISGSILVIETPVSGWQSVINLEDAEPGSAVESDDVLRARREGELAAAGAGTIPAITADVLNLTGVTSCLTFKNDGPTTDGDGRPPHSVEVVVEGGDDDEIAASIFRNVSCGIRPYGTTVVVVTDENGQNWDVGFSRPDEIEMYVTLEVTYNTLLFPVDGDDQLKAAVIADEDFYKIGYDVVSRRVGSRCFPISGVLDVVAKIGVAPSPSATTTVTIGVRERARFDTSRVSTVLTPGSL